jgi:hypothetical protein
MVCVRKNFKIVRIFPLSCKKTFVHEIECTENYKPEIISVANKIVFECYNKKIKIK